MVTTMLAMAGGTTVRPFLMVRLLEVIRATDSRGGRLPIQVNVTREAALRAAPSDIQPSRPLADVRDALLPDVMEPVAEAQASRRIPLFTWSVTIGWTLLRTLPRWRYLVVQLRQHELEFWSSWRSRR
jgi:hypothetical protein